MATLTVTSNFSASSDNTPNAAVPAGGATGDVFLLVAKVRNDITIDTWPAGFTEIGASPNEATLGSRLRLAIRAADGSESGTFTTTASAYYPWTCMAVLVSGISDTTLVDYDVAGSYAGFVSSVSLPAGTVTVPSGTYVAIWIAASTSGDATDVATQTAPSGYTTPSGGSIEPYTDNTHHVAYLDGIVTPGDISPSGSHVWGSGAARSALGIVLLFAEGGAAAAPKRALLLGVG